MKAKILIVEDDKNIRKNLVILFSSMDYSVRSAATAEAGFENIEKGLPDLIICDIILPKMNGYSLKEKLNDKEKTFDIPFIFLTAKNNYDDLRKGMELAADDYIFKPFKAADIVKSVELRLLKNKSKKLENDFVFIKVNNVIKKVCLNEINMILGENQYSKVSLVNQKKYLVRKSLCKWEIILPKYFKRVSRSSIVNINKIKEVQKLSGDRFLSIEGSPEKIKVTNSKIINEILEIEK